MPTKNTKNIKMILASLLVVICGVATGWLLSGRTQARSQTGSSEIAPQAKQSQKEAGISDEKAFPDDAEGKLEAGGINGEGTHHLVRDGGPSKNVYLTSTVIDLDSFVGKKVQVWGGNNCCPKSRLADGCGKGKGNRIILLIGKNCIPQKIIILK